MDMKSIVNAEAVVTPELYFLITKFLMTGPLKETAKVLIQELEDKKVLPKRTDWLGNKHDLTFAELEKKYEHIEPNHLLKICLRIGPILDKELKPSVSGLFSLLGSGRQSLLRRKETIYKSRTLLDYCSRLHGASIPDSSLTKPIHNFQRVLIGREYGGPVRRKLVLPTSLYGKTKLLRRTVGHLSSVYCVLFDRTGRYIITGADDLLVKIWSAIDGRLLATLRGASAEITDIAINLDNTMIAAGSIDRVLRVWDLQTTCPIAVLTGHTGMITSVNFCPSPRSDMKYLVTTSTDGSIAFWQYTMPRGQKITFMPKPTQYHEKLRPGQAQMMCTSFSPGGMFLAAGSADHHVRVYLMSEDGPKRILETEVYADAVDSVQWAHKGLRFISGSKDGTAHIWTFESQQWKSIKLSMTDRLASCPEPEEGKKFKVTMVAWDYSDKYVITAVNDFTIKIWNSKSGKLHCVLRGHKDELYVLESNPTDEHILLSAGHDGQVFLWDIDHGVSIAQFLNDIDGQGHGGVFDAKWSPDGTMIAATDSHGHLIIYGLGISPDRYKTLPSELFFHTDYRPLLRDVSHHVVDEQTQVMPHLMPPPFLVDADGNPHPAKYQRFVPGRENCTSDQLIPNFETSGEGQSIEDIHQNGNVSELDRLIEALANRQGAAPAVHNQSQLDRMIEALANRQGQGIVPDSNNRGSNNTSPRRSLSGQLGFRNIVNDRDLEVNIPPRALSVWGRPADPQQVQQPIITAAINSLKFVRVTYVRPMKYSQLHNLRQNVFASGQYEMQEYKREMRRRPIMINTASSLPSITNNTTRLRGARSHGTTFRSARRRAQGQQPAYRTRAFRDQEAENGIRQRDDDEEEEEADASSASSEDTSYSNDEEEHSTDDSDSESSDYSDWVADTPGPNLEPPKRAKRKPLSRKSAHVEDSSEDEAPTDQASPSVNAPKKSKNSIPHPQLSNGEIPELYRPAEWLSEVIPRKAPYYPQMGDEIVYFRQGHQRYLDAVRAKKVYKLSQSSEPWNFKNLRDHEFVRVIGIKYEIRPPRLCCLKLAMTDDDGNMTGTTFKIKYHDMPDVLDFLVLRQTYDLAVQRNWTIGDRFRCMIGDGWWMGQIESRHPLSTDFPDSYFMCFHVRWDNGEYEYMSPWDMEPVDENRLPEEVGGAIPVLPEEIRATLYQPKSEEWHRGDRDGSCRRIISGLEQVMRLSIAEHFLAPVDLNIYPDYAFMIEYPIDLTTIKSRFENHFYRRITSAQFDVRYLATNAEKYNRSHTKIVKHARIITDLCLRVIREPNEIDVAGVYHQMVDVYHSSESEQENDSDAVPSTSTGPSTSVIARQKAAATRRSSRIRSDGDWRLDCRQLLDRLWRHPDSAPFREPVDTMEFPDYLEIIPSPMDLRTVKEDLLGGNYECPSDFAKDVRLIFQNSRNYNTNTRSRIYAMTLRLSSLFEQQFKNVLTSWKAAKRKSNKNRGKGRGSSSSPTKRSPPEKNRQSSRRGAKHTRSQTYNNEINQPEASGSNRMGGRLRNINSTSNSSNRVTSSSYRLPVAPLEIEVRSSRRVRRNGLNAENAEIEVGHSKNHTSSSDEDEEEDEENEDKENEEEEDDDEDDEVGHLDDSSEDSASISGNDSVQSDAPKRRGRPPKHKNNSNDSDSQDSEESYKPENFRRARKTKNTSRRPKTTNHKKRKFPSDSTEDNTRIRRKQNINTNTSNKNDSISRNSKYRRNYNNYSDEIESPIPSNNSHLIDESTQDAQTPKKKGRPPKKKAPDQLNGNIANVGATRIDNSNLTENDHSYHLPASQANISNGRPTRQTVKRNFADFDAVAETEDESDVEEEILPTISYRSCKISKIENDSDDKPSTSRAALAALRNGRTKVHYNDRNSEDDLTSSDDDAPLVKKQTVRNTSKNSSASLAKINSSIITRSNATSSNAPSIGVASSSSLLTSASSSVPIHDHNYLGNITSGTSRQSVIRSTRQGLSRHQRNASELDSNPDSLENSTLLTSTTQLIAASSSTLRSMPRRGRSQLEHDQDNSDIRTAEETEESLENQESGEGKIGSDSEEDDQPLTNFVKKTTSRSYVRGNQTSPKTSSRSSGRSNNYDEDYENSYSNYTSRLRNTSNGSARGNDHLAIGRGQRRAKNEKRPRYKEQSDEDDEDEDFSIPQTKKRIVSDSPASKNYKQEQEEEDISSSEDERLLSVSSRGRIRKIIPQARRIFKD